MKTKVRHRRAQNIDLLEHSFCDFSTAVSNVYRVVLTLSSSSFRQGVWCSRTLGSERAFKPGKCMQSPVLGPRQEVACTVAIAKSRALIMPCPSVF